ncbi:MAG: energy transducer TonB [Bacteroidetes bacterium]|nr:energy transducer TonB [Bacteroidota bacterium]
MKSTCRLLVQIGAIAALPLLILACSTHWLRENLTVVENENVADTVEWGERSDVYEIVEEIPELIGGLRRLQRKVVIPESCRKANVEGLVIVRFIVDEDGNVREPKVTRSLGSGCDEEAIRVIMEEAKFTPGRQRGRAVPMRISLPIVFKLR